MAGPTRHIDHVGILVRSIDRAVPYYVETLGLILEDVGPRPDGTVRLAYLRGEGLTMIQLVEPLTDGPAARALAAHGEGLHHICFMVDELEPALAALPGQEGSTMELGGRGSRTVFLSSGPAGVRIELCEPDGARPSTAGGAPSARPEPTA